MKNTIKTLIVLIMLIFVQAAHAQSNPYFKVAPTNDAKSVRIIPAQAEFAACVHATLTGITTAVLSTAFERPISTLPTYLVMCYGTGGGRTCSTGTTEGDMKLYGRDNSVGVKAPFTNPLPPGTPIDGITWSAPAHVIARFAFINFLDQAIVQGNTDSNSLKIGSQVFTPSSNCKSIATDPYGVVFDNTTLEPVLGAEVLLSRLNGKGVFVPLTGEDKIVGNLINPQTVGADGVFNYVVDPGTYKLNVASHSMISDASKLNPKASRVYQNVYHGESFVEEGVVKHLNIPVSADPTTIASQRSKLMTYSYTVDRPTSTILFEGRASHPLTTVSGYTYATNNTAANPLPVNADKPIDTQQADTGGVFTIKLPLASIPPGESFGLLKLEKRNLSDLASSGKKTGLTTVSATDDSYISLNPIPEKIEGYLTDKTGTPLKHTRVDILLPYAEIPYLSTTTDSQGFLQIPGSYLPSEPFSLRAPDTQLTWTTSEFLAGNGEFYEGDPRELIRPLTIVGDSSVVLDMSSKNAQALIKERMAKEVAHVTPVVQKDVTERASQENTTMIVRYLIIVTMLLMLLICVLIYALWKQRTNGQY